MASSKLRNKKSILQLLSYLYIYIGFYYMIFLASFRVRLAPKPIGWVLIQLILFVVFIMYVAMNHILIRRMISNKLLLIIEALLFVSIGTLIASDVMWETYGYDIHVKGGLSTIIVEG